jgi:sugar (pentulose or hexulose) kinase
MATKNFLAFDIGAESGRAVLGKFDGRRMTMEVIHRFPNGSVPMNGTLFWDFPRIWQECLAGLTKAVAEHGPPDGVGVDTWGVDYGFLDQWGHLARLPVCYRDARTEGILERAYAVVDRTEIYRRTGLQLMRLNTLFQLIAECEVRQARAFDGVSKLLFTPDLINYFLTGTMGAEYTIASTSQMLEVHTKTWDHDLLERFQIPSSILPDIIATGTNLGALSGAVVKETGAQGTVCIASAGHDTAAAVAAVPASGQDWCFISSGTWSLMGAEITEPVVTAETLAANFTNEGGVSGTIRFLKNIMGLWLVQQCKRSFARSGTDADYATLTRQAADADPFGPVIDPDADQFLSPSDMPTAVRDFCTKTGQKAPERNGAIVRCCLESLACRYRWTLEKMERLLGRSFSTIHIVGGGSQNELLCQMTADCCRRPVVAGPSECTALGNLLVQAMGMGELHSLREIRTVVRASTDTVFYQPTPESRWDDLYTRFLTLAGT